MKLRIVATFLILSCCLTHWASAGTNSTASSRPKVGVVLGGGGALGIAHIGVLRVLEEMHVPIDYIGGTSMGSIIAGLYASGLSPDEIEGKLLELDWWDVLKDKTQRRDLDYRRKLDDSRYLMDLEMGLKGMRLIFPQGFASGQKFNNLLQTWTINAAAINDFDELNIPFRAVATDLRSGKAVVLDHGNLATAMRASMAVPGVFTPIELEGNLLVDGGLVDNIPVDVVRGLGADIIIAVDVGGAGAEAGKKAKFDTLGEILGRTYAIMQRPKQEEQMAHADIVIVPELLDVSASDFHKTAEIVPIGEAATRAMAAELKPLSVDGDQFAAYLERQRYQAGHPATIRDIRIVGNEMVSEQVIKSRMKLKPGDEVNFDRITHDLQRVYGIGDFQTVNYRLIPEGKANDLEIAVREKYWGPAYVRLGLRLETDFDQSSYWSALLNYTRTQLNPLGGEVRLDLEGGRRQRAEAEWFQPLSASSLLFISPSVKVQTERQDVFEGSDKIAEYERQEISGRLDVGTQFYRYGELRIGYYGGSLDAETKTGESDLPKVDASLGGPTARLTLDRLDSATFPRTGYLFNLKTYAAREDLGSSEDYDKSSSYFQIYKSFGDHTIFGGIEGGTSFGSDIPAYDEFLLGGPNMFAGLSRGQIRGDAYGVGHIGYYYRLTRLSPSLGEGVYVITRADVGNAWPDAGDADLGDVMWGGLAGLGADTILGPLMIGGGVAEDKNTQFFMSLGSRFGTLNE